MAKFFDKSTNQGCKINWLLSTCVFYIPSDLEVTETNTNIFIIGCFFNAYIIYDETSVVIVWFGGEGGRRAGFST